MVRIKPIFGRLHNFKGSKSLTVHPVPEISQRSSWIKNTPGIIKCHPFGGNETHIICMVNLKDFPAKSVHEVWVGVI